MDLLIPHSWLKKFLDTKATPKEIAKYASLCGPSFERIKKSSDGDSVYSIEVTTNRVDSASVYGIARELSAILPRFGIKATFKNIDSAPELTYKFTKKVSYLNTEIDASLCPRFMAVVVRNVKIKPSPKEIQALLEKSRVRSINNVVDVSNYIMKELGQPVHTFDYDKIVNHKMILRTSKKGESLVTLDRKSFTLPGGDIVIEDGDKRLIDLCGIMGGENSMVDENTKNVLLFLQVYDKHHIRKTSMSLAQRSEAAVLFEKGVDPEGVKPAMIKAIELIEKITNGVADKNILDIYPAPYKSKIVKTQQAKIENVIGIELSKKDITTYLESLGFIVTWSGDNISIKVPSFRAQDIDIPEDIAEEVARIYGYHNLPSKIMEGVIPLNIVNPSFDFEEKIKNVLVALGGIEIYNLSLTSKGDIKLKNPLGSDTEYLRASLLPSLEYDLENNSNVDGVLHLFELSNIYIKRVGSLPEERLMLAGIIKNQNYRFSKGTVETLLNELGIDYSEKIADYQYFLPGQSISIISAGIYLGKYGNLENGGFYYEFEIEKLINGKKKTEKFQEPSKNPPQIEDLTFILPEKTHVGEMITVVKSINRLIDNIELTDIYENAYTFKVWYQDPEKTLTNSQVEKVRKEIVTKVKEKFGGQIK